MGSLSIEDLEEDSHLDKAAMREIRGGQVARLKQSGLSELRSRRNGFTGTGMPFARLRKHKKDKRKEELKQWVRVDREIAHD